MSKQIPRKNHNNGGKPSLPPLPNPLMTQNQLIDSLTAHISLYHSRSLPPNPNPNPSPRSSILKWFSSLSVHQRQCHLTVVDHKFTQLLLQMLAKLHSHGHGRFIILPDLPSRDLPGLCFKKSRGLLSRTAQSNQSERLIFESARLFDSKEGENIAESSCSVKFLDSMTVAEELVRNVETFVAAMDELSNGGFLRGEENELGADWLELEWLKARGYYSAEAFAANRLEVALRLAWLNCNGGKKRGVKLKEKVAGAGVMANVFWRKKGCVDWWENLDAGSRKKVWNAVLGKAAKSLTREVLREASSSMEDGMQLCRAGEENPLRYIYTESSQRAVVKQPAGAEFSPVITPSPFSGKFASSDNVFNSLLVLQDIVSLLLPDWHSKYSLSKVFFSSLGTVNTISDCILRKLRGLFMVISLDCTRIELLGEGNFKSLPNKSKAKPSSGGSRRKKAKNHNMKKLNPVPAMSVDETPIHEPIKDLECGSAQAKKTELTGSNEIPSISHRSDSCRGISSSPVEMEHSQEMALEKVRTATRKNKKGKKKKKNSSFNIPVEARESEQTAAEVPCFSVLPSDEPAEASGPSDNMMHDGELIGIVSPALNTTLSNSPIEPAREDMDEQGIHELGADCMKSICHSVSDYQPPNGLTENQTVPSRIAFSNRKVSYVPTAEFTVSCTDDINIHNNRNEGKSVYVDRSRRRLGVKEEPFMAEGKKSGKICGGVSLSSSDCLSYEWPSLAPVYFSSINPHIPPATDRLHLDVGRNWHNHIRQPFVPTVHQARNSPIENGCNRVLSRPLPMSLEWPPVVRSPCGIVPSMTCNYDSGFISRRQSAFQQNFSSQNMQFYTKTVDDERKYSGDNADFPEATNSQELTDECESHWMSEEEIEVHALSGRDYNQYFGGGVMYWNPSDHMGGGFSRAPSLSSDDGSWAWHEADLNRAVDDMVAFSSPYSTNGLTSPTAASFCSAFDPLVPGNQALGYVVSGNDVPCKVMHSSASATDAASEQEVSGPLTSLSGDVEGKMGDTLPYPILPPIIIPSMSRERSRSDFRRSHDHKSPCIPPTRREHPRIKRPPSPVVLCVPRAPRPPPPSPVSDSRKHRGVPTVRSGSSSPRHWGMRGSYNDGNSLEEGCMRMDGIEVVWPSWRNKNLPAHPMIQPLPGALLQDRLIAISQLARDQEHPDVSFPLQSPELQNSPARRASLSLMHSLLQDEIDLFCKQVAAATTARKPFINWTVKRVTRSLQVLWPRSRTNIFGSNATGMSLPTSDVDLVVCLPPVRNLEPIKEAGILEGRNGIKETCLQHAARYLANQEWVKNDSLKTVENTAIPIIMLVVEVPGDLINSVASNVQSPKEEPARMTGEDNHVLSDMVGSEDSSSPKCSQKKDVKSIRLDISFKSPSHTGHQTTKLVKELTEQFPAVTPLALVLKKFLADRSLDQSYSGGLSSYCLVTCARLISISPTEWGVADLEFLAFPTHPAASFLAIDAIFQHDLSVLLITRFLQHQHHHGRPINQNLGSLLMDFLYFFGNVFDPRQMRISVQGSGVYINRERGHSIDPVHIDDPLFPTNNVGRNCFRIHQCIKAFSEAYSILENELTCLPDEGDAVSSPPYRLLPKIIPSINILQES